jgi:glycosyltransferase involved in cell wall biosynthesis
MNGNEPLVSVVVPVYNAASYLHEFCMSLLAQSHRHFEVLMLDDGSTDNSWEILQKYASDPRFRLMQWEKNRGLNRTWFQLLTKIAGDYWCSPGADDVLKPQFLQRRVELLKAHPHAVFAHGPPEVIESAGHLYENNHEFGSALKVIEVERGLEMSLV